MCTLKHVLFVMSVSLAQGQLYSALKILVQVRAEPIKVRGGCGTCIDSRPLEPIISITGPHTTLLLLHW